MKKISSSLLLCAAAAILLPSCKKDKEDTAQPVVNCNILVEKRDSTTNSLSIHTYEYDAQDRVIKETVDGAPYLTMEYLENGKKIREVHANNIRIYTLNDAGRLVHLRTEENNGSINETTYILNGDYIVRSARKSYAYEGAVPTLDTGFIENTISSGNLIKMITTDGNNVTTINFTYDLSKPANAYIDPKAYSAYAFFPSGPSTNLVNSVQLSSGNANQYMTATHELDSKGRVKKQRSTGTYNGQPLSPESSEYIYRCE